jgi:hypothetical protein
MWIPITTYQEMVSAIIQHGFIARRYVSLHTHGTHSFSLLFAILQQCR